MSIGRVVCKNSSNGYGPIFSTAFARPALTAGIMYDIITLQSVHIFRALLNVAEGGFCLIDSDNIRGHLDAIILRLISEKDRYGYEISKEITERTSGDFQIKEATLYAVFQRLEKKELIESYLGDKSFGGKRRYYKITSLGRAYLSEEIKEWKKTRQIIDIFLEGLQ